MMTFIGENRDDAFVEGSTDLKVESGDYIGFAYFPGDNANNHGSISHTTEYTTPQPGLHE